MAESPIAQDVLLRFIEPSDRLTNFLSYLDNEYPGIVFKVIQPHTALHQMKIRVESLVSGTTIAEKLVEYSQCYSHDRPKVNVLPPVFIPVEVAAEPAPLGPDP